MVVCTVGFETAGSKRTEKELVSTLGNRMMDMVIPVRIPKILRASEAL